MKVQDGDIIMDSDFMITPYLVTNSIVHKTAKVLTELIDYDPKYTEEPYILLRFTKSINIDLNTGEMILLLHWEEK